MSCFIPYFCHFCQRSRTCPFEQQYLSCCRASSWIYTATLKPVNMFPCGRQKYLTQISAHVDLCVTKNGISPPNQRNKRHKTSLRSAPKGGIRRNKKVLSTWTPDVYLLVNCVISAAWPFWKRLVSATAECSNKTPISTHSEELEYCAPDALPQNWCRVTCRQKDSENSFAVHHGRKGGPGQCMNFDFHNASTSDISTKISAGKASFFCLNSLVAKKCSFRKPRWTRLAGHFLLLPFCLKRAFRHRINLWRTLFFFRLSHKPSCEVPATLGTRFVLGLIVFLNDGIAHSLGTKTQKNPQSCIKLSYRPFLFGFVQDKRHKQLNQVRIQEKFAR